MPAIYPPQRRTKPMTLDAVRVAWQSFHGLMRIDHIRGDGIAVCSRINEDGTLKFLTLADGRRFALRGVAHWPVSKLEIIEGVPLVKYPECEFCGDPAERIEKFDRDVFVCNSCSA